MKYYLTIAFALLTIALYAQAAQPNMGISLPEYDCLIDCDDDGCLIEYVTLDGCYHMFIWRSEIGTPGYVDPSVSAEQWVADQFHARIIAQNVGFVLKYNGTYYMIKWSEIKNTYILHLDGVGVFQHDFFQEHIYRIGEYAQELTVNSN